AADPAEKNHREVSTRRSLATGDSVQGRLGFGDDVDNEGRYSDSYVLDIRTKSQVVLQLSAQPFSGQLIVLAPSGKRIGELTFRDFKKTLEPAFYTVRVTSIMGGEVGTYTLTASVTSR